VDRYGNPSGGEDWKRDQIIFLSDSLTAGHSASFMLSRPCEQKTITGDIRENSSPIKGGHIYRVFHLLTSAEFSPSLPRANSAAEIGKIVSWRDPPVFSTHSPVGARKRKKYIPI